MKRKIVSAAIGTVLGLAITSYAVEHQTPSPIVINAATNFYIEEVTTIAEEVIAEEPTISKMETTTEEVITAIQLFDVPLVEELQLHIIKLCEEQDIEPALVIAVIERESCFKAEVIGDNGDSFGLMQIQKKWHQERMDRLGCTNLLNPFENVTVGIDILAELMAMYHEVEMALCAYNAGVVGAEKNYFNKGIYSSNYSKGVMEICQRLNEGQ
jgi:hypothetical protein